jgi:hypothetical protein
MITAWTMFQGIKRGCGKVPDCFVDDALESHHKNLIRTEPLPYEPTVIDTLCLEYLFKNLNED